MRNVLRFNRRTPLKKFKYKPFMRIVPLDPGAIQLTGDELETLQAMAAAHCPLWEIAHSLDFTVANFKEMLKLNPEIEALIFKKRAKTQHALRTKQIQLALEGNASMLMYLGRHILNQNDNAPQSTDAQLINGATDPRVVDVSPEAKAELREYWDVVYGEKKAEVKEIETTIEPISTEHDKGNYK